MSTQWTCIKTIYSEEGFWPTHPFTTYNKHKCATASKIETLKSFLDKDQILVARIITYTKV